MKNFIVIVLLAVFSSSLLAEDISDYFKERLYFASKKDYNPYALQRSQKLLLEEHYKLGVDPKSSMKEVKAPLDKLIELYPLSVQGNLVIAKFLKYIAEHSDNLDSRMQLLRVSEQRKDKADAILQSIVAVSDGYSKNTAFKIINVMEENAVLKHLELERVSLSVVEDDKKYFDKITVKNKKGDSEVIYFDISAFFGDKVKKMDLPKLNLSQ